MRLQPKCGCTINVNPVSVQRHDAAVFATDFEYRLGPSRKQFPQGELLSVVQHVAEDEDLESLVFRAPGFEGRLYPPQASEEVAPLMCGLYFPSVR